MSAAARSQMRPPVTLALATSVPVVFQLLSVGDRRVVQLDGRGGGGSLNPVGEGIAGPVQVVGGRRGAPGQAVVDGPLVVIRIMVRFPLRFHGRSVEGVAAGQWGDLAGWGRQDRAGIRRASGTAYELDDGPAAPGLTGGPRPRGTGAGMVRATSHDAPGGDRGSPHECRAPFQVRHARHAHHAQAASAVRVRYCEREPILRTAWILGVESGRHKILDRPIPAEDRGAGRPVAAHGASRQAPRTPPATGVRRGRADDAAGGRAGEGNSGGPATVVLTGRWIAEPGLWFQFDWGSGPKVPGPAVEASARRCCSAHGWRGPAFTHRQREDDDHRLGHRDRGPSSSSRALGPGGNLFGNGGNQYGNGACPSPRPHR